MQFTAEELNEFNQECIDLLDQAEASLLALAKKESLKDHFNAIFRVLHSVKGAAGMSNANELQAEMHTLETFFSQFEGRETIESTAIDRLLAGIDVARKLLGVEISGSASSSTMSSDESLNEFIAECREIIQRLNLTLGTIEKSGPDVEKISLLYRDIHTIKGSSGLFGFSEMENLAHQAESLLEKLRSQEEVFTPQHFDNLYITFDFLETMTNTAHDRIKKSSANAPTPHLKEASPAIAEKDIPSERTEKTNEPKGNEGSTSLRVSVDVLDRLMTLVGEMVLVRNQVTQFSTKNDNLDFINLSQRLDVVTSEIQAQVMKTRMQPIGTILSKFQRVVRDMAKDLGKKINLEFSGSETELDKALLEAVKDPLMHIVRNACDHAIETPNERLESGKSDVGCIAIKSFHEGGQVVIEVSDNGKGLDKSKILKKAIEKNLITADKINTLSDKDIYNFIFAPGFSTATAITNISGRGVGMDVVKKNIERIGGVVDLETAVGQGTTIRLKIPLTLAIVPAMVVRSGSTSLAIPQVKLVELVRLEKDKQDQHIEFLKDKPVYRLRGQLLPIIDLHVALGNPRTKSLMDEDSLNIVVVSGESLTFGIIVDEVQDTADIVVKPLSPLFKALGLYSGATVLGDGSISLILDVTGLLQSHHLVSEEPMDFEAERTAIHESEEICEFLVVKTASPSKQAIPLSMVMRMEEFSKDMLERSGDLDVVRYRGSILPILSINKVLGYEESTQLSSEDKIPVVVTKIGGKYIGLRVNQIVDVIYSNLKVDSFITDREGIFGNIVHQNEVIVVLDIRSALRSVPFVFKDEKSDQHVSGKRKKILFAEDTEFFRRNVKKLLVQAGYDVVSAEHGKQALSFLDAGADEFDLILSDIEMPEMNGYELARSIRSKKQFDKIPLIALTTRFNERDQLAGKEAGFDSYLEKLNGDELLQKIQLTLEKTTSKEVA